jgi:hypothetical protein
MNEQVTDREADVNYEMLRLSSEADRSIKAAMFSLRAKSEGARLLDEEVRSDVKRAAIDQHAFFQFLRSGAYRIPEQFDDDFYAGTAGIGAMYLRGSSWVKGVEQHLHLSDLGTSEEPLALDRYTAWLQEPRHPDKSSPSFDKNGADIIRWHIQAIVHYWATVYDEPLR